MKWSVTLVGAKTLGEKKDKNIKNKYIYQTEIDKHILRE